MQYHIHHRTHYTYEESVSYSHHLMKLKPLTCITQQLNSFRLVVTPQPDNSYTLVDYFKNNTAYVCITNPHRELIIDAYSEISLSKLPTPNLDFSPLWEGVASQLSNPCSDQDLRASEFSFASSHCPKNPEFADYALESFKPGTPILHATDHLTKRIYNDFKFDKTASNVNTPVSKTFKQRAGVCQDFAHLQIAMLRSLGLAAIYVSGYLRTEPPPGSPRLIGADASHAWVSVYVPQFGWIEFDATNNVIPTTNHIKIAQGRDYDDICPIRGTFYGGGTQRLKVGVTVTPMS
jgi:transglutaminase-like putative cysteine protease